MPPPRRSRPHRAQLKRRRSTGEDSKCLAGWIEQDAHARTAAQCTPAMSTQGGCASTWKTASSRPPLTEVTWRQCWLRLSRQQAYAPAARAGFERGSETQGGRSLDGRAAQKERKGTGGLPARTEDTSRRRRQPPAASGACGLPALLALITTTLAACAGRASLPSAHMTHSCAPPSTCPLPCVRVQPCMWEVHSVSDTRTLVTCQRGVS